MRFGILGPLEVTADGRPVVIGGLQRRVLLTALLLEANHVVPVGKLTDAVWGFPAPERERALPTLRTHVSELRRRLGPNVLVRDGAGYVLRIAPDQVDEHQVRQLLEQGRRALDDGDTVVASGRLEAALKLWRGPALDEIADRPFAAPHLARLDELRLDLLKTKIEADLALGRHREVVGQLRGLVDEHPFDELLRGRLALALHRDRRQDEAARVCREGLEVLHEQGLDSESLRRLQQDILRGAPELDFAPRRALDQPYRTPPASQALFQLPRDVGDFTGRDKALVWLHDLLAGEHAHGGEVTIAAIAGKAGVGKTALAVHVAHRVRSHYPDGALYVDLRGTQSPPLEPSRVLSRFLQALGVARAAVPDDLDEQVELYQGKLAGRRMLVVLDNAAHEAQVRPLLPGAGGCAAVVTSRRRLSGLDAAQTVVDVLLPDNAVELLARVAGRDRVAAEPEAT